MDFITSFPVVAGNDTIFIVVDRLMKYTVFMAATSRCPTEEAASMFWSGVVKHFGVLTDIISDQDGQFTG